MNNDMSSSEQGLLTFCTSNVNKFLEAQKILRAYGITLQHHRVALPEIQDDDVAKVAAFSAAYALRDLQRPLIVEDTGLYIDALHSFPGAYAAFIEQTIGNSGVLKLMENIPNRSAEFRTAIAFAAPNHAGHVVIGCVHGMITDRIRQDPQQTGWGYNPIFIPDGQQETYAEMGRERKNVCSHRHAAFALLADWLTRSYRPAKNSSP